MIERAIRETVTPTTRSSSSANAPMVTARINELRAAMLEPSSSCPDAELIREAMVCSRAWETRSKVAGEPVAVPVTPVVVGTRRAASARKASIWGSPARIWSSRVRWAGVMTWAAASKAWFWVAVSSSSCR
jgi:hypothetical protein